jgi:hypothetical protein
MSVNLQLVGTKVVSTSYQSVPDLVWPDESLGWFTHHFVLEPDLKFIAFLLGVNVKKLFDLFHVPKWRQGESKQDLIEKLDKNWKELQNNVTDVLNTIAELQSKLLEENEKLAQPSDAPIIFPPGNPIGFALSPRKSYQRIQELGVMEALDELSAAVKGLANQGVETVWIEEA